MAITTETSRVQFTLVTGNTEELTVTFGFDASTEILVTRLRSTVETELTVTTDYSVLASVVTMGTTALVGDIITITRLVPFTQDSVFVYNSALGSTKVATTVDRLCQQIQRLNTQMLRCLRLTNSDADQSALSLADRAGKYMSFDASGDVQFLGSSAGIGSVLESTLATSISVTKPGGSPGAAVIFDSSGAPTVTLTAGTWALNGGVTVRTSDTADAVWAQFYDNTNAVAFGGGPAVYSELKRLPVSVTGTITVAAAATIVIYFKVITITNTLDVGSSTPSGPAGFISAVRIA